MATRLIQVIAFPPVGAALSAMLPHQINVNGQPQVPDFVAADAAGFDIGVTATTVTVTNNNGAPTPVNVWLELKHTIPRQLGAAQTTALVPQPFVASPGGASGGGPDIDAVIFDDSVPAAMVNIRSNRASNQSPIDNTKAQITNLGSQDGTQDPTATGATGLGSTIGGGDDNTASGDYSTVVGGGACRATGAFSVAGGNGRAQGDYATGLGNSFATADYATASGGSNASGIGATALGFSNATADGATALGNGCLASGESGFAAGNGSIASGVDGAIALGNGCTAAGDDGCIAAGNGCDANGNSSAAFCNGAQANGDSAFAAGNGSLANGDFSTALCTGITDVGSDYSCAINASRTSEQSCFAHGEAARATRESQHSFASGNFTAGFANWGQVMTSKLVYRGLTPGVGIGESTALKFAGFSGAGLLEFVPEDGRGYSITIQAIARGDIAGAPNVQSFKRTFAVRRTAGVTTIAASGAMEQIGDGTSVSWTLALTVGVAPDRLVLTFTTGVTTSAVKIAAEFKFVEILTP